MVQGFSGRCVEPRDVEHSVICRSDKTYCAHPRTGAIYSFGGGEIALLHWHAPCEYEKPNEVEHGLSGYFGRAVLLLQRSCDGGRTWPKKGDLIVHREDVSLEEKRKYLFDNPHPREQLDMSQAGAVFLGCRSWCGDPAAMAETRTVDTLDVVQKGEPSLVSFMLRSIDKGRTWEKCPLVIPSPRAGYIIFRTNDAPPVRLADGMFVAVFYIQKGKQYAEALLYGTDDDGLSWSYLSRIGSYQTDFGWPAYASLLALPDGRLMCVMLNSGSGRFRTIVKTVSHDGGLTWSQPESILRLGCSPWRAYPHVSRAEPFQVYHRSPCAILLRDGRILVLYARRRPPFGIGGLVSDDLGETWSDEFVLRADATCFDIGYQVAVELDDGTVFTAYYYTTDVRDQSYQVPRYIAGTHFRI